MSVRAMAEGISAGGIGSGVGAGIVGGLGNGSASAFGVKKDGADVPFAGVFALAGGTGEGLAGSEYAGGRSIGNQGGKQTAAKFAVGIEAEAGATGTAAQGAVLGSGSGAVLGAESGGFSPTARDNGHTGGATGGDVAGSAVAAGLAEASVQRPAGPVLRAAVEAVPGGNGGSVRRGAGVVRADVAGNGAGVHEGGPLGRAQGLPGMVAEAAVPAGVAQAAPLARESSAAAVQGGTVRTQIQTVTGQGRATQGTAVQSAPPRPVGLPSGVVQPAPVAPVGLSDVAATTVAVASMRGGQSGQGSQGALVSEDVSGGALLQYDARLPAVPVGEGKLPLPANAPQISTVVAGPGKGQVAVRVAAQSVAAVQGGKGHAKDGLEVVGAGTGAVVSPLRTSVTDAGRTDGMVAAQGTAIAGLALQPVAAMPAPLSQNRGAGGVSLDSVGSGVGGSSVHGSSVSGASVPGPSGSGASDRRQSGTGWAGAGLGVSSLLHGVGVTELSKAGAAAAGGVLPLGGRAMPRTANGPVGVATEADGTNISGGGEGLAGVLDAGVAGVVVAGQKAMGAGGSVGGQVVGPIAPSAVGKVRRGAENGGAAQVAGKSVSEAAAGVSDGATTAVSSAVGVSSPQRVAGHAGPDHFGPGHVGQPVFQEALGGSVSGGADVAPVVATTGATGAMSLATPPAAVHAGVTADPATIAAGASSSRAGASSLGEMAGAGTDLGVDSGLMAGMGAGPGTHFAVGHTTLQATPTVLEVGVPGGANGWVKIRAELGEGGSVQASMTAATEAGREALHRDLPGLSTFLESEHVPVSVQVTHAAQAGGTMADAGGSFGGGSSGGAFGLEMGAGSGSGSGSGQTQSDAGFLAAQQGGGEQRGGQQREPVSGNGVPQGVAAAERGDATDASWAGSGSYGGAGVRGGSWLNVMA